MEIYLAVNRQKDPELSFTRRLQDYIRKQGCGVRILRSYQDAYQNYHFEMPREPGVILALGGDGTYLQCVNDLNLSGLTHPVLGVNLGSLGFMAELESKDLLRLRDLCDGKYEIESHMMLDVSVQRDGRVIYSNLALNEALIARGNISRVIRLQIFTEQGKLVDVAGDGVIVASPTGSTAYSLSAGGPVVEPTARNLIVSPICAHSVHANSYVLSPERTVTVQTEKTGYKPIFLSADGGRAFSLRNGDASEGVLPAQEALKLLSTLPRVQLG